MIVAVNGILSMNALAIADIHIINTKVSHGSPPVTPRAEFDNNSIKPASSALIIITKSPAKKISVDNLLHGEPFLV